MAIADYIDVNPDPTGNTYGDLLYGENAVLIGSLYNLFKCPRGDRGRIFRPDYGASLYGLLQEPIDDSTSAFIRMGLLDAVARWEPRIELLNSYTSVTPDYSLPGYIITIGFRFVDEDKVRTSTFGVQQGG
jgi:phage baseplate assembly protein W